MDSVIVALASLLAGFIDSIVGGGGLILVPALFATYPSAVPGDLLGTNKSASIWGTGVATLQYARRVRIRWQAMLPAALTSFAAALLGAWTVTQVSAELLRKLLPLVLLALLLYTLARKELGRVHAPTLSAARERLAACAIALVIGFYDGFFGPGTGSFFIFFFVRFLGYDFLNASVSAKLLNLSTNASSLMLFAAMGHVWWQLTLWLAAANIVGSVLGARLALRHGAGFVRGIFIIVVGALILKTARDAFLG
ncbi:sulfite exporter TauE/SafE family protein [Comamonas flocculans]|uniref:Probable membrane transporter protein n=1 Tax=Comamonas flocculans TaxID=2597701 RepID=A0A5B8RWJ7_9BURK|nr:TSUP family transporter [Comamonas flocculans]QEA13084.1 TSUP family transporter [Comamonas flocculans]